MHTHIHLDLSVSMNRSPLSDFNRRRSLLDSPNLVGFINKTVHSKENRQSHFDSTTTSSSETYSTYNPLPNPRIATTRKLSNMNEQSPLQLNRGTNSISCFFPVVSIRLIIRDHSIKFNHFRQSSHCQKYGLPLFF